MDITVQVAPTVKPLPSTTQVVTWASATLKARQQNGALSIRFVDSSEMQSLNAQYRQKDKPTNVLSFPNPMPLEMRDDYLGDIVCCVPVIEQEARYQKKSTLAHYAHMIVHGILHLLGFDHQIDADALAMETIEIEILAKLGFPNPYGAVTTYD